jgi:hypothetical protein
MIQLPTSTFPPEFGGIGGGIFPVKDGEEGDYTAPALGEDTEVLYYSADRTGRGR